MDNNGLIVKMTEFYEGQPHRIQHFMKVYAYARMIGEMEGLPERERDILETASVVHDIGIKISEEKYGDSIGSHQEKEGPPAAEEMLAGLGYDRELIDRVCYLVGHHHTYTDIDGMDYQILVEADFLVNMFENETDNKPARATLDRIFRTETGKRLCRAMFATDRTAEWTEVGGMPR